MLRKIGYAALVLHFVLATAAVAEESESGLTRSVLAGAGLPTLIEVAGRLGYQMNQGRFEAGVEAGYAPFLGPGIGIYGHVGIADHNRVYLTASHRNLNVVNNSSDMRAINTTSIGVGKKLKNDMFVEVQLTASEREHRGSCNVSDCVANGTTDSTGIMVYAGQAF